MNTVILTGNLGADPESFFTPEGTHIVTFPFAFRSSKDKTSWIKITVFNKTAEVAVKYLHKGARIGVSGMLDQDKWETEEGETRSAMKLIGQYLEFIKTDGRGFEEGESEDGTPF
jgi:single-strand DNA-binding protein